MEPYTGFRLKFAYKGIFRCLRHMVYKLSYKTS